MPAMGARPEMQEATRPPQRKQPRSVEALSFRRSSLKHKKHDVLLAVRRGCDMRRGLTT